MSVQLDLADIQGNILSAYGHEGFPKGRFMVLHVARAEAGRAFLSRLRPQVTTALRWPSTRKPYPPGTVYQKRPEVALNFGFTFRGLLALGVPIRTLRGMPDEFIDGMPARADILGDSRPRPISEQWDPVWLAGTNNPAERVHILLTLNAQMMPDGTAIPRLDEMTQDILDFCTATEGGVRVLPGHSGEDHRWQNLSALLQPGRDATMDATPREHFGFTDGIGDPMFQGRVPPELMPAAVIGQGKLLPDQTWAPLATGEFLLGHPDESQEIPGASMPLEFSRNGTFFAYRKLHQNARAFRDWVTTSAQDYGRVMGVGEEEARETLMAKMAGRWTDGTPLVMAPTWAEKQEFTAKLAGMDAAARRLALTDFTFRNDPHGAKCPFGAHLRRSNTRDMLDPYFASDDPKKWMGSALNNRRRILRRGLPYGVADADTDDSVEHGIVMLAGCANLFRQFEFLQQQWMQYGLDFNQGSDVCPIIGNHGRDSKFVIAADPNSGKPPFFATGMPQFVEVRGGDYFFVPSMSALRMIAQGLVDPT